MRHGQAISSVLRTMSAFKIGDTLTEGEKLHFGGIPSFSPEMFKYIENADPMKQKQLAKRYRPIDG